MVEERAPIGLAVVTGEAPGAAARARQWCYLVAPRFRDVGALRTYCERRFGPENDLGPGEEVWWPIGLAPFEVVNLSTSRGKQLSQGPAGAGHFLPVWRGERVVAYALR